MAQSVPMCIPVVTSNMPSAVTSMALENHGDRNALETEPPQRDHGL